jgi:hypothetical protein
LPQHFRNPRFLASAFPFVALQTGDVRIAAAGNFFLFGEVLRDVPRRKQDAPALSGLIGSGRFCGPVA